MCRIPPFLPTLLIWTTTLLPAAAEPTPYTGPYLKLPPLTVEPAYSTTAYEVHGDVGTMQESPGPAPAQYWLTAWVERMPIPETDRIHAPSVIRYRRLGEDRRGAEGLSLVLAQTASSATLRVVRGTGGAWILAYARTDGLRAWWIPADPAMPVPSPLSLWGIGGAVPSWTAAGDGTSVWVWLETAATGGEGWYAAAQQRIAVLSADGGMPALRHMVSPAEPKPSSYVPAMLCASGGVGVLTYADSFSRTRIVQWNTSAQRLSSVELPGYRYLGTIPWSDDEFLTLKATPLHPLAGEQIFGTRLNRLGQQVPGTVPLLLANVEQSAPVRSLRTGGVMSSPEGSVVIQPGANFPLSLTGTGAVAVTGVDGTPGHWAGTFSNTGEVYFQNQGPPFFYGFPLTTGNGFSSRPLLSWGLDGWPMLSWTQQVRSGYQVGRTAFHRRQQAWQTLPTSTLSEATHASGKGFYNIYAESGNIRGMHWRVGGAAGNTLTGTPIEIAEGFTVEKLPVFWYDGFSRHYTGWVEQSTDQSGDLIHKIRQRDIYITPSSHKPAVTCHITTREITRLISAGTGQLTWLEKPPNSDSRYLFSARAGTDSNPLIIPQFIASGVSELVGASDRLIAIRQDYQTLIFSRFASPWTKVPSALSGNDAVTDVAVAGNCLFWIAPAEDGASLRLYLQTFTGLNADPAQLVPTGPVLPGQLAAAADQQGRHAVSLRLMEATAPVLTTFVLAPGESLDPALRPSRETLQHLTLRWNPTKLFPSYSARFQRSADLIHWEPVPPSEAVRSPQYGPGDNSVFTYELTQPGPQSFFYRMEAQMVP